jgi:glucosamine--fructose-6-phosphate aminotransferase (isomerizing)
VTVVALTNDASSPIAQQADQVVPLVSGAEASVSCKSYLNSLAWFHRFVAHANGRPDAEAVAQIVATANTLRSIHGVPEQIEKLAARVLEGPAPRLALVGTGADAATALAGALILKEASKVSAEGYAGGAFRHGPIELAGPGLAALLFSSGAEADVTVAALARDLSKTGSIVVSVAPENYEGAEHVHVSSRSDFDRMALGMNVIQHLSVSLAKKAGIVPGKFRFGQKITSQL